LKLTNFVRSSERAAVTVSVPGLTDVMVIVAMPDVSVAEEVIAGVAKPVPLTVQLTFNPLTGTPLSCTETDIVEKVLPAIMLWPSPALIDIVFTAGCAVTFKIAVPLIAPCVAVIVVTPPVNDPAPFAVAPLIVARLVFELVQMTEAEMSAVLASL